MNTFDYPLNGLSDAEESDVSVQSAALPANVPIVTSSGAAASAKSGAAFSMPGWAQVAVAGLIIYFIVKRGD